MEYVDSEFTRGLASNVAIGLVLAYGAAAGICLVAVGDLGRSLAIAAVPGVFAGPYVGLLITLVGALRRAESAVATPSLAVGQEVGAAPTMGPEASTSGVS